MTPDEFCALLLSGLEQPPRTPAAALVEELPGPRRIFLAHKTPCGPTDKGRKRRGREGW